MIRRYEFGSPMDTGAVLCRLAAESAPMPFFTVSSRDGSVSFSCTLEEDDQIFGLGENVRGIS